MTKQAYYEKGFRDGQRSALRDAASLAVGYSQAAEAMAAEFQRLLQPKAAEPDTLADIEERVLRLLESVERREAAIERREGEGE